jgi:hypothetical protein
VSRAGRFWRLPFLLAAAVIVFAGIALILISASLLTAFAIACKSVHNGLTDRDPAADYARHGITDLEHHLAKERDR